MTMRLPIHSPAGQSGLDSAFAARVLGRREERRLANLLPAAEQRALDLIRKAALAGEADILRAREEAEAILAALPDFAALAATPGRHGRSAYFAIRDVVDRHGLSFSDVTRKDIRECHKGARRDAIRAVADACPGLADARIGMMFSGLSADTVHRIHRGDPR
jgi:hypothetical protein